MGGHMVEGWTDTHERLHLALHDPAALRSAAAGTARHDPDGLTPLQRGLVETLRAAPGTASEIGRRLGIGTDSIRQVLPRLGRRGLIRPVASRIDPSNNRRVNVWGATQAWAPDDRPMPAYYRPVLAALCDAAMTTAAVAQTLGISRGSANNIVSALRKRGLVRSVGRVTGPLGGASANLWRAIEGEGDG